MNQQEAIEAAKELGFEWVAMYKDGLWFAYQYEPKIYNNIWGGSMFGEPIECLGEDTSGINWEESLEEVK